jgi:hypothetical protein
MRATVKHQLWVLGRVVQDRRPIFRHGVSVVAEGVGLVDSITLGLGLPLDGALEPGGAEFDAVPVGLGSALGSGPSVGDAVLGESVGDGEG